MGKKLLVEQERNICLICEEEESSTTCDSALNRIGDSLRISRDLQNQIKQKANNSSYKMMNQIIGIVTLQLIYEFLFNIFIHIIFMLYNFKFTRTAWTMIQRIWGV